MFLHIKDFQRFYAKSKVDGLLWMGTFLCVLLTSADIGLGIGIILTIFVMAYRNYDVSVDPVDISDEVYGKGDSRDDQMQTSVQTLRLSGSISFANWESMINRCKSQLYINGENISGHVSRYINHRIILFLTKFTLSIWYCKITSYIGPKYITI